MPIVEYIKGDITETTIPNIAHCVNCQDVMGSGVAKALFTKWNLVKNEYHKYCKTVSADKLLGDVHWVEVEPDMYIANCFGQFNYGKDSTRYVNYVAIAACFSALNFTVSMDRVRKLAIPKVGCGLAGGDWDIVKEIINDATPDIEVYVYEL